MNVISSSFYWIANKVFSRIQGSLQLFFSENRSKGGISSQRNNETQRFLRSLGFLLPRSYHHYVYLGRHCFAPVRLLYSLMTPDRHMLDARDFRRQMEVGGGKTINSSVRFEIFSEKFLRSFPTFPSRSESPRDWRYSF